jgi:hypothetical protein
MKTTDLSRGCTTMGNHQFVWVNPRNMAIFNSCVTNYQRVYHFQCVKKHREHITSPSCRGRNRPCYPSLGRLPKPLRIGWKNLCIRHEKKPWTPKKSPLNHHEIPDSMANSPQFLCQIWSTHIFRGARAVRLIDLGEIHGHSLVYQPQFLGIFG